MCGIFAIVSFSSMLTLHDAVLNLGEKARVLSYRGTQSAGILLETKNDTDAFYKRILQDKIVSKKQKNENPFIGFFEEFSKNENVTKEKTPFVGMIHTRWATTGGEPTEINAQPMKSEDDGEFALVLNGNLTNAGKLRKEIIRKSANKINFKTTTDTEVIARLFYEIYHEARNQNNVKKHGKTVIKFEELCKKVSEKCQGLFTIVVKSKHYPDEVVSFANRQPLYIGFGSEDSSAFIRTEDKNTYVCPGGKYFEFSSDSWALNTNIKYFYKLEEGDIAKLSKKGLLLIRDSSDKYSRKKKEYPIIKKYVYKNVNVGSTEGSMLREINEQSQCLSGIIYSRVKGNNIEFDEISDEMINKIIERRHFYFIGCGSSYNVGLSIKQAFTDLVLAETVTAVNAAMLVDDNHRVNAKDAVYIFITQSGTTSDTNMALEYCLERGALCIGVTNVIPSTASEKCHATIEVMAGFEVAVASTKAYTCQFLQLFLFAAMLGKRKAEAQRALLLAKRRKIDSEITPSDNSNRSTVITSRGMGGMTGSDWEVVTSDIIIEKINSYVKDLESFIGKVNDVLSTDISGLVRYMGKARNSSLLLVSRGSEFPTVTEAVLKISEVTQIAASCYYSSELAHGPVALVNKNSCIILVEPPETSMQEKYFLVYEKIGTANAVPFIICTSENSSCSYDSSMIGGMVILPETNYLLQGIITAIAFQRAAHDVCVSFGNSPDVPPNLAKSVTVPT